MFTSLLVIFGVSILASLLTFFSGFGLGTLLMPVMALYFPLPIAIAATAVVHFVNNIFKSILLFKMIHFGVFLKFAFPALVGTLSGVWLLTGIKPLLFYNVSLGGNLHPVFLNEFLIGVIILLICLLDWIPENKLRFGKLMIIPGGFLTGFFGGFSGMQGAIRSAFLSQIDLTKEEFVATSAAISILIDSCRIIGYMIVGSLIYAVNAPLPVVIGVFGALSGALLGKKLLKKTSIHSIKLITGICLIVFAAFLFLGII